MKFQEIIHILMYVWLCNEYISRLKYKVNGTKSPNHKKDNKIVNLVFNMKSKIQWASVKAYTRTEYHILFLWYIEF